MKTILRTIILLAAAMLVVGATLAISRTTWGSGLLGGGRPGFGDGERLGGSGEGNLLFPEGGNRLSRGGFEGGSGLGRGEGRGEREGHAGIGSFTWLSLLRNAGIIVLIVVVYALLDKLFSRRKPRVAAT